MPKNNTLCCTRPASHTTGARKAATSWPIAAATHHRNPRRKSSRCSRRRRQHLAFHARCGYVKHLAPPGQLFYSLLPTTFQRRGCRHRRPRHPRRAGTRRRSRGWRRRSRLSTAAATCFVSVRRCPILPVRSWGAMLEVVEQGSAVFFADDRSAGFSRRPINDFDHERWGLVGAGQGGRCARRGRRGRGGGKEIVEVCA